MATTEKQILGTTSKGRKKVKNVFSSPWASAIAVVIAVVWTIPTFGLFVSSFRPQKDINTTGWWTFFSNPNVTLENYQQVLLRPE